jgi:hypothetical protein
MAAQLPVRLRMLVPAVENAISGSAYRCVKFVWAAQLVCGACARVQGVRGVRGVQ